MAFSIERRIINGKYGPCYTIGRAHVIDHILLHHTASGGSGEGGGAVAVWNYWWGIPPGGRVSADYIVGKDGTILKCVDAANTAWHAGSSLWNARSIGIEIVNLGNGSDPYPDKQVQAVAWLCRRLMAKHPAVEARPYSVHDGHQRLGDIWEHSEVCAGKIDMSANFPWKKLYGYIKNPPVAVTGDVVKVPVPVVKPSWWSKLRDYLKRTKTSA